MLDRKGKLRVDTAKGYPPAGRIEAELHRQLTNLDGVHHQADKCAESEGSQPERHQVITTRFLHKGNESKNESHQHDNRGLQPRPLGPDSL